MNRLLTTVVLLSTVLPPALLSAQELPIATPESVGFAGDKLSTIGPKMAKFVEQKKVAGAIAIVARQGKVASFQTAGRLSRGELPMTPETIVRIYSMSKPITSVAIMMLVEEGKLRLDDPIAKHLPDLQSIRVFDGQEDGRLRLKDAVRPITVADLLRHTSGLTYGFFGNTEVDKRYRSENILDNRSTLADMIKKLGQLPLANQPGAQFRYSVSTDVLGRIVEVASGERFDKFLRSRIFQPLDMRDTAFFVPAEKRNRFAANFGPQADGLQVIDDPTMSRYLRQPTLYSGGGGLVSTARDYMRFCQMLLNEGQLNKVRLLKSDTVRAMTQNQLPEEAYPINLGGRRDGVGFGFGFSVVVEKTPYTKLSHVGEYGWGGAASTHFWISPKDQLAVVVLTQLMPFDGQLENAVKPIVYDALKPAP